MDEKTVGNYIKEMEIKAHYRKTVPKVAISPSFDEELKNNITQRNLMLFGA